MNEKETLPRLRKKHGVAMPLRGCEDARLVAWNCEKCERAYFQRGIEESAGRGVLGGVPLKMPQNDKKR